LRIGVLEVMKNPFKSKKEGGERGSRNSMTLRLGTGKRRRPFRKEGCKISDQVDP